MEDDRPGEIGSSLDNVEEITSEAVCLPYRE